MPSFCVRIFAHMLSVFFVQCRKMKQKLPRIMGGRVMLEELMNLLEEVKRELVKLNDKLEDITIFEEAHSLGEICAKLDVLMERE